MISATLVQTPSANAVLLAVVGISDSGGNAEVTSIVQGNATWQRAVQGGTGDLRVEIWYSIDAGGETTAVTINTVGDGDEAAILEERAQVSSIDGTAVDQSDSDSGTSTTIDSGQTAETTYPISLLVAGLINDGGATGALTGGFTQVDQITTSGFRLTMAVKATTAAEQGQTTTTASSGDYGGAIAAFFSPTLIDVTAVTPSSVGTKGGDLIQLDGVFGSLLGSELSAHVGTHGTEEDEKCWSGKPGFPRTLRTIGATIVRAFTPELTAGSYKLHLRSSDGLYQRTLLEAVTVFPSDFKTSVLALRKVLPPRWRKGALTIGEEP